MQSQYLEMGDDQMWNCAGSLPPPSSLISLSSTLSVGANYLSAFNAGRNQG